MSSSPPSAAVCSVLFGNEYRRIPLEHPHVTISMLKQYIRRKLGIDNEFDMIYKGQLLSETDRFHDLRIKSSIPLKIRIKSRDAKDQSSIVTENSSKVEGCHKHDPHLCSPYRSHEKGQNKTNDSQCWAEQCSQPISHGTALYSNARSMRHANNLHDKENSSEAAASETDIFHQFSEPELVNSKNHRTTPSGNRNSRLISPADDAKMVHSTQNHLTYILHEEQKATIDVEYFRSTDEVILVEDNSSELFAETVKVSLVSNTYDVKIYSDMTLKDLYHSVNAKIKHDMNDEKTNDLFPLLFNHRMHLFTDVKNDRRALRNFLLYQPDSFNNPVAHFSLYFLREDERESMYNYDTESKRIFSDSKWWTSRISSVKQEPLAQSMFLVTLYALHQYFGNPSKNKFEERQYLQRKFLTIIQWYLFRPAVMALVHALQGGMFAFEKTILFDGFLKLLREFCPEDVEESTLGAFMPHLICWLFEKCDEVDEETLPCISYDLGSCLKHHEHHFNDNIHTEMSLYKESNILSERISIDDKKIAKHMDLLIFTEYLKNTSSLLIDFYRHTKVYTTLKQPSENRSRHIDRLTEQNFMEFFEIIAKKYPEFKLKIGKNVRPGERDQIVLLKNERICLALCYGQSIRNGLQEDFFYLFDPSGDRVRAMKKDFYRAQRNESNNSLLEFLLDFSLPISISYFKASMPANRIDQITIVLVDDDNSKFNGQLESQSSSLFTACVDSILHTIGKHLVSSIHQHALGLIQFGSQISILCPITTEIYHYEQAMRNRNYSRTKSVCIFDAIKVGIKYIKKYQEENSTITHDHDTDKLLVLVSNSANTNGNDNWKDLKREATKAKVRIDLIPFLLSHDRYSKFTQEERIGVQNMKGLCEHTKGVVHQIKNWSPSYFNNIYDQETSLLLRKRGHNDGRPPDTYSKRREFKQN